jgi:dihydropteridine reductase
LTGALAALNPTPGMIGYGIAKSAVHHLVYDLAQPNGGLPEGAKVSAILPYVLPFFFFKKRN